MSENSFALEPQPQFGVDDYLAQKTRDLEGLLDINHYNLEYIQSEDDRQDAIPRDELANLYGGKDKLISDIKEIDDLMIRVQRARLQHESGDSDLAYTLIEEEINELNVVIRKCLEQGPMVKILMQGYIGQINILRRALPQQRLQKGKAYID